MPMKDNMLIQKDLLLNIGDMLSLSTKMSIHERFWCFGSANKV